MTVEIVTDVGALAALEEAWSALLGDDEGSPTMHPRWQLAAARTLHADDELYAPVVTRGNAVVAVAALARPSTTATDRLELLGCHDVHEPGTLAHRDADGLADLVSALLAPRRPLHLGRLAPEGGAVRLLSSLPTRRAVTARRPTAGTPYIPITGDWERFERSISRDRRSSLRRNGRRAEEAGGFRFEVAAPDPSSVDQAVADFVAVEDGSWKHDAGTSLAVDPRRRRFYAEYARAAADAGELRIARLWIGDALAAVQLAVHRRRRLWILKLGCDERWSPSAPGIVLTHLTLQWAFERGLEGYELLGDAAPWTTVWTRSVHPYTVVRTYPTSVRSLGAVVGDVAHQARKRAMAWG